MDDIIEKLYAEFNTREGPRPEEEEKALEEFNSMCERVQGVFGLEFVDRLTLLKAELDHMDDIASFRRGFVMGFRLREELGELTR